ncbi:MAG TPA: AarF/ABC1/UbiB kinase family protein [Acidimicrobiales bacterium]|nr:AarF/ABC1/UbiB kinase family protein [Acidimicrobiales bacterium]
MAGDDRTARSAGPPTGRIRRTAPVARLAARTAAGKVVAAVRRRTGGDMSEFHARSAERYAELLGQSKGALMKAGQMLSFVGAAFPEEQRQVFQSALRGLQADAPPMAYPVAAAMFEAELGRRPEQVFAEFGEAPVAAASIGQVHEARLPDGRRVAVKIQYPGAADAIRADLDNLELLATVVGAARTLVPGLSRMDTRAVAEEIAGRIDEELDYRKEAENQGAFARAYRGHPFIHVPEVVPELSTDRVLTQQFVDGWRWSDALSADQALRDRWGEVIFRFAIGTLRRHGLFNADPHPGNYLFHPDGTVTFVDFGCVKRFARHQIELIQDIVRAAVKDDGDTLHAKFVEVGMLPATGGPSPDEVLAWYADGFEMFRGRQPYTLTPEAVAAFQTQEMDLTGPHARVLRSLNPPPDFVFLARIDLGMLSVLAELRATGWWEAIRAELDDGADPVTELGRAEAVFRAGQAPDLLRPA